MEEGEFELLPFTLCPAGRLLIMSVLGYGDPHLTADGQISQRAV